MRVAVMGTACVGKSTFIKDFLKNWAGVYTQPEKTYRDVIDEKKLPHSKVTTEETQQTILDFMVDQHMKYTKTDNVIFDRCPIDNLVYSIHAFDKGETDIDEKFIEKCIPIVKETMRFVDLLFYIPRDESIEIEDDGFRETDTQFIDEINNLFKQVELYSRQDGSIFFHDDDKPAVISISGGPRDRIKQASMYITDDGQQYGEGESEIDWEELAKFGIEPRDVYPGGKL